MEKLPKSVTSAGTYVHTGAAKADHGNGQNPTMYTLLRLRIDTATTTTIDATKAQASQKDSPKSSTHRQGMLALRYMRS